MFGSKTYKVVVGVCVHTMGCIEERNGSRYAMDGSGQSLCGPCLLRGPGEVSRLLLPLVCSPVEHLQEEKQPASEGLLWIQQAAFVSPNSQTPQKATVGRGLLSGKGATSLERNSGKKQLYLCPGPYAVYVSFEMHPRTQSTSSTHTNTSVNPIEVQSLLSGLYAIQAHSSFSRKGYIQITDDGASSECPKASSHRWTADGTDTPN